MLKDKVRNHFEDISGEYDRWKEKSAFYYQLLAGIYRECVPEGANVLEIGCGTGTILSSLKPSRGVGVDISPGMVSIAAAKFPHLTFLVADAEVFDPQETFDYVIVPDVVEHLTDVGEMFRSVRRGCHAGSRLIITCANPLWAPVLHLAERLGMKMPEGEHRWLPPEVLLKIAVENGFVIVEIYGRILCPKKIPVLARYLNMAAERFTFLRQVCLTQVLIFSRP
jgi:ubiquinone/menaquinone biosynthesis C-methylase UbiE